MAFVLVEEFYFWFSSWGKDFGKTFVFVGFDFGKRVLILVKRHCLGYTAFDFGERIFDQKVYVRQKMFRFGFKKSGLCKSFFVTRLLAGLLLAAGCLLLSLAPANSLTSSSVQTQPIHKAKMQSCTTSRRASSRRSFSVFWVRVGSGTSPGPPPIFLHSYLPTLKVGRPFGRVGVPFGEAGVLEPTPLLLGGWWVLPWPGCACFAYYLHTEGDVHCTRGMHQMLACFACPHVTTRWLIAHTAYTFEAMTALRAQGMNLVITIRAGEDIPE